MKSVLGMLFFCLVICSLYFLGRHLLIALVDPGSGEHRFDTVVSSEASPDGRYIAKVEDFGDDADAFESLFVYSTAREDKGDCALVADVNSYHWIDSHTLSVSVRSKYEDDPVRWRGVSFAYTVQSP